MKTNYNDELLLDSDKLINKYNNVLKKESVKSYIFAGHSIFTVESTKINKIFTYKIDKYNNKYTMERYRVYLQINDKFCLIGYIDDDKTIIVNANKNLELTDIYAKIMLQQFLDILNNDKEWPKTCKFYKSNKCPKCGKILGASDSIKVGYGPVCKNKLLKISIEVSGGNHNEK